MSTKKKPFVRETKYEIWRDENYYVTFRLSIRDAREHVRELQNMTSSDCYRGRLYRIVKVETKIIEVATIPAKKVKP